ncbi:MAG TPA: serine/threonine-protein kinase [Gemmataceae bacterium]
MLGTVVLGRYEVVGYLGRGSMGQVYVARPKDAPSVLVVVKRMNDHVAAQPRFRQLFQRELQAMRRFRHPYAVRLFDGSLDDPHGPCIVMEYIPGETLEVVLRREPVLDPLRVGGFLGPLCHALEAAHETGLVHRDLKPANLMVVNPREPEESLRVMDLGLAQLSAAPHIPIEMLTGDGGQAIVGTPAFICPEQVRGDDVDGRGDIYSVGVILYEMLTGSLPFRQFDTQALLRAHLSAAPPPFARHAAGRYIPAAVEQVVLACLAKFPYERPQTARDLAERYGEAIGVDIWGLSRPADGAGTPDLPPPPPPPPPPAGSGRLSGLTPRVPRMAMARLTEPPSVVHELEAWMPERIAAVKIRGFAEDMGGRVLDSEPGWIRVRLGEGASGSRERESWLAWIGRVSLGAPGAPAATSASAPWQGGARGGPAADDPIDLELRLEKPDPHVNRLRITAQFRPVDGMRLRSPAAWRRQCDRIHADLKAYLIANS